MPINFSLDAPLSLYCLPLLLLTAYYPHVAKKAFLPKYLDGGYPNTAPRSGVELCKQKGVPQDVIDKIVRMESAHANGLENAPLWAASILAANISGFNVRITNILSAYLVVGRILYNYFYINGTTRSLAAMRSVTFNTTAFVCLYMLVKSAGALNAKGSL